MKDKDLLEVITEALRKMEDYPDDNVVDIWNESLRRWDTGLKMNHRYEIEIDINQPSNQSILL